MRNGDSPNDAEADMELKNAVETFLDGILDSVEDLVNERKRDREIQESVRGFYNGILNDVTERLTDDRDKAENIIEENRLQMKREMVSRGERRNDDLSYISRGLRSSLPVTSAVVPGALQEVPTAVVPGARQEVPTAVVPGARQEVPTAVVPGALQEVPTAVVPGALQEVPTAVVPGALQEVPIFSLQKGLANMMPLATLMVPETGQQNPNMISSASPSNREELCPQPMKNKENKAKQFSLWKAWNIPKKGGSGDQKAGKASKAKKPKSQKLKKKRDNTYCNIAHGLKRAFPVSTMMVPLAADSCSTTFEGKGTLTGVIPSADMMVGLITDNIFRREATNEEDIEMTETFMGIGEKQIKLNRWTKLRQSLKTLFQRTETKMTDRTVEKADADITVTEKADTNIEEDIMNESCADKQKSDMKTTIIRTLREVSRRLRCRA